MPKTETGIADNKYYQSWQTPAHADYFDCWADLTAYELKRVYERHNEFQLLKTYGPQINGSSFVEIGCATGELYRYIRYQYPEYQYTGFDISQTALARAKQKYPAGEFHRIGANSDIMNMLKKKPAIVFSRDVILHQTDPFGFLDELLRIPEEALVLRLRTREKGATVLDPELSCQWHYNGWLPYIILNFDETIERIKNRISFDKLHVAKNFIPLGGSNGRYLPKDCYDPQTGTAETAIFIKLNPQGKGKSEIVIEERAENLKDFNVLEYALQGLRSIGKKIKSDRMRRSV